MFWVRGFFVVVTSAAGTQRPERSKKLLQALWSNGPANLRIRGSLCGEVGHDTTSSGEANRTYFSKILRLSSLLPQTLTESNIAPDRQTRRYDAENADHLRRSGSRCTLVT
jgi:hypothetical protein